jgi:hypothetical protein
MNTNALKKYWLGLVMVMVAMGSLPANERPLHDESEKKARAIVGERALTTAEVAEIEEERARVAQENGAESADGKEAAEANEEGQEGTEKQARAYVQVLTPYSFHAGAFHYLQSFGFGDIDVKLQDGSLWSIRSIDQHKMPLWYSGDQIVITPNHTWFSSYKYQMNNQNIGQDAEVNLKVGPYLDGPFTYRVVAIDYFLKEVQLNDGTWWDISIFDGALLDKWLPGDYVIIGINDEYDSSTRPYILINANINTWIKADWL